ncbi:hypothetical protein BGZ80_002057 [Entomortierella chlamydospora]|uniref:DUF7492 domain-containing protein n=1 Tax=Entomortierella chlamydospora TaxID=101097 RepID=A0A9P6N465_9FUNG|nr:hypothetical protein BGZ79_007963 [Entomortierella chlamydospora]KAG0024497.1 hypothetical protein BGZ80_002057 [Entomortierella chlamydospora]
MPNFASTASSATLLFCLFFVLGSSFIQVTTVQAHSWLDCANTLPSGKCAGYPIGYPTRANPDINTLYTYLISGRVNTTAVCQPGRQDIFPGKNPANLPPTTAVPGQKLHLTWEANGHMNNVQSSSEPRTKVQVYWTGVPKKLIHTRAELSNPKLLLATMDFATPQNCDEPANPNTVCNGYITIPKGTKPGKYQLVWWWRFDKNPVGEEYSTCFEVDVKTASKTSSKAASKTSSKAASKTSSKAC